MGTRRALRASGVTLAAALATLLNPYGIRDWLRVLHTVQNPMTRAVVSEWQPLLFRMEEEWHRSPATAINFAAVIVPLVAMAVCFAIRPRGGDLPLVVIAAMMGMAACVSVRNMALVAIATAAPLCRHAALLLEDARPALTASAAPRRLVDELLVGAVALALAFHTKLFSPSLPSGFAAPAGAVDFMRTHGLGGNVLCEFAWGEYFIFHMAPRSKVFIDGRYDYVYSDRVIADYLDFFAAGPRSATALASYPHDFVLIATDSRADRFMTAQPLWRLVYRDSVAALYARTGSAAARLRGIPLTGRPAPNLFP